MISVRGANVSGFDPRMTPQWVTQSTASRYGSSAMSVYPALCTRSGGQAASKDAPVYGEVRGAAASGWASSSSRLIVRPGTTHLVTADRRAGAVDAVGRAARDAGLDDLVDERLQPVPVVVAEPVAPGGQRLSDRNSAVRAMNLAIWPRVTVRAGL